MKRIYHERKARVIYSLTTDRQAVIYWPTNHLLERIYLILTHKKRLKGKCILQMFPVFRHYMTRNPAKILTVVEAFTCISWVFDARKRRLVTPSNVMKMKTGVTKQIKMTSC